jgi:hypothetical protein
MSRQTRIEKLKNDIAGGVVVTIAGTFFPLSLVS